MVAEILVLVANRQVIRQLSIGGELLKFSQSLFVLLTLSMRAAKALTRLHVCAGSSEQSPFANASHLKLHSL